MKQLIITMVLGAHLCAFAGEISDAYFKKLRDNPEEWIKAERRAHANAATAITNHGVTQIRAHRMFWWLPHLHAFHQ
jgi:hypothetical protein